MQKKAANVKHGFKAQIDQGKEIEKLKGAFYSIFLEDILIRSDKSSLIDFKD